MVSPSASSIVKNLLPRLTLSSLSVVCSTTVCSFTLSLLERNTINGLPSGCSIIPNDLDKSLMSTVVVPVSTLVLANGCQSILSFAKLAEHLPAPPHPASVTGENVVSNAKKKDANKNFFILSLLFISIQIRGSFEPIYPTECHSS